MSAKKLSKERALLAVIDLQEAFEKAVLDFERVATNSGILVEAAKIIGLDVVASEQYPKGLGRTVPQVSEKLGDTVPVEKVCFSAYGEDAFRQQVIDSGKNQVLLCGIETHVCVWQTACDLLEAGLEVHVVEDAVTSRTAENRDLGLHRMEQAGAQVTSVETALFELLGAAGSDEFKAVQKLIK